MHNDIEFAKVDGQPKRVTSFVSLCVHRRFSTCKASDRLQTTPDLLPPLQQTNESPSKHLLFLLSFQQTHSQADSGAFLPEKGITGLEFIRRAFEWLPFWFEPLVLPTSTATLIFRSEAIQKTCTKVHILQSSKDAFPQSGSRQAARHTTY